MYEIELYIEKVPVQPWMRGQLLGNFTQLLLGQNDIVEEFEYGCGPSSASVAMTYEYRVDEDEEECESQEGDDQSERAEDVQHNGDGVFEFIDEEKNNVNVVSSFLALHKAMESEQGRYVSVNREGCDMSNNPDPEDLIEFFSVQYHLAPSLQFENVENIVDLQHAAKLYSISAHQKYVVVSSTTKLLVLRCKKAEQSQCLRKPRAMVIKDRHPGIMAAMSDVHLGWSEPYTYHRSHNNGWKQSLLRNERSFMTEVEDMEYRGHSSDPDPLDMFVLVLQDRHRSHLVDSGVTPPTSEIKGSAISTRWLCYQFSHPLVDSDGATLERLHLGRPDFGRPPTPPIAQYLEHDAADDLPVEHLDQGLQDEALLNEGLLADLLGYRWRIPLSWAQNPSRVLTFYQGQLDAQTHDQVLWEPYVGDLVAHLPAISLADQEIWRTMPPLICFDIVEWHRSERVLR
ncbi:Serine/threonine-protein phosphatase 7 long form-like [Vitis vinifera]|uniref:Serine/threonine-protein phosphatase 7 long form-like n=1 Tax=Vitis vinifera TaxID=29760 RepID=A0A438GY52_VITVI|nr:Serine/threonine-protein phosphatase 7 long form-like [Vitis vinifera]